MGRTSRRRHARGMAETGVSPFNFGTFAAFLCWFGGTGYLLERYSNIWFYRAVDFDHERDWAVRRLLFWFLAKLNRA
jgi:hypothetical protein